MGPNILLRGSIIKGLCLACKGAWYRGTRANQTTHRGPLQPFRLALETHTTPSKPAPEGKPLEAHKIGVT